MVACHLRVEVADVHVDQPVVTRSQDRLELETPDIGIDRVVNRGSRDDAAELQVLVLVVEAREINLCRAIQECVLRADFEGIDLFRIEAVRNREDRRQWRIDATRLVAARIGEVDFVVG